MSLSFGDFKMRCVDSVGESSLADIHGDAYIRATVRVTDAVAKEDSEYIGKGMISTLLPYKIEDVYDRNIGDGAKKAPYSKTSILRRFFCRRWAEGCGRCMTKNAGANSCT